MTERPNTSVVSFLKVTWHGVAIDPATETHLFHRYLARLCSPEELWENTQYAEDEDDSKKPQYVMVYMEN